MESLKDIRETTSRIHGWLTSGEGEFLYKTAKNLTGRGVIVEIGSWKGKSTVWLGKGSQAGKRVKVFAIDPHTGAPEQRRRYGKVWTFDEFLSNIRQAGIEDIVIPLVKTSEEAAREWKGDPVEFLWIDGAHDYPLVKLDLDLWSPKLIEGGIIAFHDSFAPGPSKVIKDHILRSRQYQMLGIRHSTVFAKKVARVPLPYYLLQRLVMIFYRVFVLAARGYYFFPMASLQNLFLFLRDP